MNFGLTPETAYLPGPGKAIEFLNSHFVKMDLIATTDEAAGRECPHLQSEGDK